MVKTYSKEILGSKFSIILEKENETIIQNCFNELKRIEKKFSRFDEKSKLNKFKMDQKLCSK